MNPADLQRLLEKHLVPALAAYQDGRHDEAEAEFHAARDELARAAPKSYISIVPLVLLAEQQYARGKYGEAEVAVLRALAELQSVAVAPPKLKAAALAQLGKIRFLVQGKPAEAEALYRQARDLLQQLPGPRTFQHGALAIDLGQVLHALGHYDETEQFLQEALAIWEQPGLGNPVAMSLTLQHLAKVRETHGRYRDAEALLRRAVGLLEGVRAGPDRHKLKGAVYIHPTLAEGFWTLMEEVKPVE
jgi:eukaryotic-like serine/threonine-protein kinase